MSKISMDFKLKDLYAIKHALLTQIDKRKADLYTYGDDEDIYAGIEKDLKHEEKILKYIIDKIENII